MLLLVAACKAALNRDAMQINGLLFIFEKVLCFLGRMFGQDVEVAIAFEVQHVVAMVMTVLRLLESCWLRVLVQFLLWLGVL